MRLRSLRLLADENISPRITVFLRSNGFDVMDVKESHLTGAEDRALMRLGIDERRFILTHDADFGAIAINGGEPCFGAIYLRLGNQHPTHAISILAKLLETELEVEERSMIVVEDHRIRVRRLP